MTIEHPPTIDNVNASDPAVGLPADGGIVLFDGVCNLCNWSVRFIAESDPVGRFRFASLQSEVGQRLLATSGRSPSDLMTVILLERDRISTHSTAALRIARGLRFPWNLFAAFLVVPRFLRDPVYDFISRHRYRVFGRSDTCAVPTPDLRARFLE